MAAKSAHNKTEVKQTARENLIEFRYLLAYQMKANWLAFCISRLLGFIFIIFCFAISSSIIVLHFEKSDNLLDLYSLSGSQIIIRLPPSVLRYAQFIILAVLLSFTGSTTYLLLRLWNASPKQIIDIHSSFEGTIPNKLSYYLLTWAGPFSLTLLGLDQMCKVKDEEALFDGGLSLAARIILIAVSVVYLPLGWLFSYVGFSDRRSANNVTLQPLSNYLWYDQISFTLSAFSIFSIGFGFNISEYIFVGYLALSSKKWTELSMLPFSDTAVTQFCLIINFCENISLVVISFSSLFRNSINFALYFSLPLILAIFILAGRVGSNLGTRVLLSQLFNKSLNLDLTKIKLMVWILADVRLRLKQIKEQPLLLNRFYKDSFFFLLVSFFKRHKSECHLTNCICHGRSDKLDGDTCVRPKKYINLKSMIKDLITLSLRGVISTMSEAISIQALYIYAHWLVHCERNVVYGLVTIAQLKARNVPVRIMFALEMLVREIRLIHESRQNNLSEEKIRQNSLVEIIRAQKEFEIVSKNSRNFLRTFESLCSELISTQIVFQEVENYIVRLTKEEERLKGSMEAFKHNPKIRWFKQIFTRQFALHFNFSLETTPNKLNTDIESTEYKNYSDQNFFLLVGSYGRDLNKILDCSKNIDQLLGKNALATRYSDINKIIPQPVSESHNQYLINYINKAKSEIMDKVRLAFLVHNDGYLISVNMTIKNFFDYKNHRFLFFCHIKKKKQQQLVLCDNSGFIYGMTQRISKVFAWNPTQDVGNRQIYQYIPQLGEFFAKNKLSKKLEPSLQQKLDSANNQLMHTKLTYFSLSMKQSRQESERRLEDHEKDRSSNYTPAMQVIYQTLSRYCKYQPRRYKIKANITFLSANSSLFYVINFSKINPVQLSDIQIKSRWMTFLYRITIMKLFVKSWKLGHDINVRENLTKNDPSYRKASTFRELVRTLPATNRRVGLSSIMVSNHTLPRPDRAQSRESIIKVKDYLPLEFTLIRWVLLFFVLCVTSYSVYSLNYLITKTTQTISFIDDTISPETIFNPLVELMTAKQFKNDFKAQPGLDLATEIESNWSAKAQKVFDIFQLKPELISESAFENSNFIYNSTDDTYERVSQYNVFDTMTHAMYYLNRKTVSPRLVTKSSGMLETIRQQLSKSIALNPSMIIIDELVTYMRYDIVIFTITFSLFFVIFFVIFVRLHRYKNMMIEFGTKIQFHNDVFRRIQKLRNLLGLGENKIKSDNSNAKKNELATITVYKSIPFPWIRVLAIIGTASVCLFWYTGFILIPLSNFSTNMIQIFETKKLITQNSFDTGIALHKILMPASIMALDVNQFRERVNSQNSFLSNDRSLSFWSEDIHRIFITSLCGDSPLSQYTFCDQVEGGLFKNSYLTASTYIIQRVPIWLNDLKSDPPEAIFASMIMIRIATLWLTEIIKTMGSNVCSNSIATSIVAFAISILTTAALVWIIIAVFERRSRFKLLACFRLVCFLRTELILSNSRIKQFIYKANRSN